MPYLLLPFCYLASSVWPVYAEEPIVEPERGDPAPARRIEKVLDDPVTVDFVDVDLELIMGTIASITDASFVIDPAVKKASRTLTLRVQNMQLRLMLDRICSASGCEWKIKDNAVHIRLPVELPPKSTPELDRLTADQVRQRVEQLLPQLHSDEYSVREQATLRLMQLGSRILAHLPESELDPEASARLTRIRRALKAAQERQATKTTASGQK